VLSAGYPVGIIMPFAINIDALKESTVIIKENLSYKGEK
jgi:hypothetical protein